MIIIFGLRSYLKALTVLTLACRNGHVAAHRLVQVTRKFTFFFIPLFPVSRRYFSVCSLCGLQVPFDKESVETAVHQQPPAPAPEGAPVDPVAPPLGVIGSRALEPPRAAPGWYPNPAGDGGFRYWDGTWWTDSVHRGAPDSGTGV